MTSYASGPPRRLLSLLALHTPQCTEHKAATAVRRLSPLSSLRTNEAHRGWGASTPSIFTYWRIVPHPCALVHWRYRRPSLSTHSCSRRSSCSQCLFRRDPRRVPLEFLRATSPLPSPPHSSFWTAHRDAPRRAALAVAGKLRWPVSVWNGVLVWNLPIAHGLLPLLLRFG